MSDNDITPADVEELMNVFGMDSAMFKQTPSTKKKKKGRDTTERSEQLAKKKQEIKDLKQNLEILKREKNRHQRDSGTALDRINELEGERDELLRHIDTLDKRIEELNSYGREDILDMDDYLASELDYQTNYIKKELERIADYYEISKRKKRKDELIEVIVLFEKDPVNIQKVYQRKKLWRYIEEIRKDKYLRQFLILD